MASHEATEQMRNLPLDTVCRALGLTFDANDKQWKDDPYRTIGIAVKDGGWTDWKEGRAPIRTRKGLAHASGGAIDLVMYVEEMKSFTDALGWLKNRFSSDETVHALVEHTRHRGEEVVERLSRDSTPIELSDVPTHWERVHRYLTQVRKIDPYVVQRFREAGQLQAGQYGQVVMLAFDDEHKQRLAETRSTNFKEGTKVHKLNATGSNKDYCFQRLIGKEAKRVYIVESGIDMMSLLDIHRRQGALQADTLYVSTAGCRPTIPASLRDVLERAEYVGIGFDKDEPKPRPRRAKDVSADMPEPPPEKALGAGDEKARKLAGAIGVEKCERLRPPVGKDWNAYLQTLPPLPDQKRTQVRQPQRQEQPAPGLRM